MVRRSMSYPQMKISLSKIEDNARLISELCRASGIGVFGVTKGVLGSPEVALAMVRGGVLGLADSHLAFLRRFRQLGFQVPLCLLRQPMQAELEEAAGVVDYCLLSEFSAAESLSKAAQKTGRQVRLVLFLEAGSLREGMLADEMVACARRSEKLPSLDLAGLAIYRSYRENEGSNDEFVRKLVEMHRRLSLELGRELPIVSGGNSSGLKLVASGKMAGEVNNLRIGEAILLGHETADYQLLPGASGDAFILAAEVIESKRKPGPDSARRIILALGREDLAGEPVLPLLKGKEVMRSSSHLVLELYEEERHIEIGETVSFVPSYFALVAAMNSPLVNKEYID